MEDLSGVDICRVCRSEGLLERPLFHPCICTGSIKWIHQECLVQWMRYSRKEYCELCGHRFSFTPIYSPDMPRRLPLRDVIGGLLTSVLTAVKYWLHYTLVAVAWLGIVPLTACRIYRCLFFGSLETIFSFPLDMLSTDNLASDVFHGCFVVTCTLFAFIGLVWLREQILHGGGPEWLENDVIAPGDVHVQPDVPVDHLDNNQNNVEQIPVADPDADEDPNGGDENNWIPMEWDRAAEELTWERLLGLDGSLVFLEHVFWVVSLNTLFVFIFAFCPYHMGLVVLSVLGLREPAAKSHFEGLLTTLLGYCLVGMILVVLHRLAALFGFRRAPRVLGLCYVVVKVAMLSVVEIGILPLVCGWWLDICSLAMFDASLKDREMNFKLAPGTSIFIHWLVGMIYVYYFASFVLLLREVLRPGVIWFLRNLNDPDFSPIQEMIHLPILKHIRRLLLSAIIFGTAVLLMLWLPVQILKMIWSPFLPYVVSVSSDAQVNELSLELLLLQVIIPALLEQSHTRIWLKGLIRTWCRAVSWLLNIHSYLLGNGQQEGEGGGNNQQPEPAGGLAAEHQAILTRDGPTGFQPYDRPRFFACRIALLLLFVGVSLVIASLATLTVPVWIGRQVMTLWLNGSLLDGQMVTSQTPVPKIHELYTAACGTYICWVCARAIALVISWLPQGRAAMLERLAQWARIGAKTAVASALLLGVIPLLSGLLLEVVIVIPLRVPVHQTPILFIWQDWALGVLYTKIACAVTMMGPEWFVRAAIERVYRDGIRDMNLGFICKELAIPVIVCFGLALAIPYVIAYSILPLFITNVHLHNLIARRIYPLLLLFGIGGALIIWQVRQFRKLYEHIKNDKYLVGQRLVNYDHRRQKTSTTH